MFSYYDPDADIAWFPTGTSDDVVSEQVPGGLRDYDRASHQLVAIEVWGCQHPPPGEPARSTPRARADPRQRRLSPLGRSA